MARSKRSATPAITVSLSTNASRSSTQTAYTTQPIISDDDDDNEDDDWEYDQSVESPRSAKTRKGDKRAGKTRETSQKLLQCPLCPPSKKRYKAEAALAMHLKSNYHGLEELRSISTIAPAEPITDAPEEDVSPTLASTIRLIKKATKGSKVDRIDTAFFEDISPSTKETQMLIICHSRDYATKMETVIRDVTKDMGFNIYVCVGGTSISADIKALFHGPHIVIGCLGRVGDMLNRKRFRTNHIKVLALDQVDHLLKKSNQEQLSLLYRALESDVEISALDIDPSGEGSVGTRKSDKEI